MDRDTVRLGSPQDHKGHAWHKMKQMVKNLDMFGSKLPRLNIAGKEVERTFSGALMSIVILCVIFLFSLLKLKHLLQRSNPQINIYDVEDHFTNEKRFDPIQSDF